jgi:hypothetical protein
VPPCRKQVPRHLGSARHSEGFEDSGDKRGAAASAIGCTSYASTARGRRAARAIDAAGRGCVEAPADCARYHRHWRAGASVPPRQSGFARDIKSLSNASLPVKVMSIFSDVSHLTSLPLAPDRVIAITASPTQGWTKANPKLTIILRVCITRRPAGLHLKRNRP